MEKMVYTYFVSLFYRRPLVNKNLIKTLKSISTGLVFVAILFAFLISGIRILGFQVFGVLTGSMEPTYPTGSLIYVKDVDPADLRVNDVITFSISPNVIATHRIVELVPDEANPSIIRYRTKGDANDVVDASLVSANNIIGRVSFCVPGLGNLASYIQEPPGIYVAILVCVLMIAFVFFTDSLDSEKKTDPNANKAAAKPAFDVTALVNKATVKVLGKPLLKEKKPEPVVNQPQQAYMPQQPYQQPQFQQYPMQQNPVQQNFAQQPVYQQPGFQPQYQQPQFQAQPQFQQYPMQQPPVQQNFAQQPMYQQPGFQPQYQQPQFQQQVPAQQTYQTQPQFQQSWPVQNTPAAPTIPQPTASVQRAAPKAYPTMFNQPQQNAPRRRSQRNDG